MNWIQSEERRERHAEQSYARSYVAKFRGSFDEWELARERAADAPESPKWTLPSEPDHSIASTEQLDLNLGPDEPGGEDELEWRRRIA